MVCQDFLQTSCPFWVNCSFKNGAPECITCAAFTDLFRIGPVLVSQDPAEEEQPDDGEGGVKEEVDDGGDQLLLHEDGKRGEDATQLP